MQRRLSYVGNGLVAAGAMVGIATVAAMGMGYEINLTPAIVHLLAYKALGAAALGLIVVGSWIGRGGRRTERTPAGVETDQAALNEARPGASFFENTSQEASAAPETRIQA